ncbi:Ribosome-recycling factor [Abditibacteriota bacterium]|nr:Ribosome-recycling factor [Abditibacteriota bacterium]
MPQSVISGAEARMQRAIEDLHSDLSTLRTGRATPALLDKVMVDYYGTPTPLKTMGQVSVPDARQLLVTPYDPSVVGTIANAISKTDLGVTAVADGKSVRVSVPTLTTERRKEMVKLAGKKAEAHKIAVRNIRQDANKDLEKMEKDGEMSKDDLARFKGDVQKITDKMIAEVDKIGKAKEAEIMEV